MITKMRSVRLHVFGILAFALLGLVDPQALWAQQTDTLIRPAAPNGDATAESPIILWVRETGKQKPTRVEIPNVPRRINANETAEQARVRKAMAVTDAINATLGPGRATLDANGNIRITNSRGVLIQAVDRMPKEPTPDDTRNYRLVPGDPTRQGGPPTANGNSGRVVPSQGSQTTPPPSSGSLGGKGISNSQNNEIETDASGVDSQGDPSHVSMGILEQYVADLTPLPGQTPASVLLALMADLEANNIDMLYDPDKEILTLANPIPDGQTFYWGSNDTDLMIGMELVAVPEPAALVLCLSGCAAIFLWARARKRKRQAGPC